MSERLQVGNLTVEFSGDKAEVIERRRKVGHLTLVCGYLCGLVDSDQDEACWSYDHGGPRCPEATVTPPASGGTA